MTDRVRDGATRSPFFSPNSPEGTEGTDAFPRSFADSRRSSRHLALRCQLLAARSAFRISVRELTREAKISERQILALNIELRGLPPELAASGAQMPASGRQKRVQRFSVRELTREAKISERQILTPEKGASRTAAGAPQHLTLRCQLLAVRSAFRDFQSANRLGKQKISERQILALNMELRGLPPAFPQALTLRTFSGYLKVVLRFSGLEQALEARSSGRQSLTELTCLCATS